MVGYKLSIVVLFASLAGCAAMPSYQVVRSSPHKDVLSLVIYLDDRAGPEVYRRIALDEVERIRAGEDRRPVPLYEVKFEFRLRGPESARLAEAMVYLPGDPAGSTPVADAAPPRLETVLH